MTMLTTSPRAAWITVVVVWGLFLGTGCSTESESAVQPSRSATASQATSVILDTVVFQPERTRVEAVGTSRARQSVMLYPAVSGEVVALNFKAGQRVAAGDVLVELDKRNEVLAVELAQVRLANAERQLNRYRRMRDSGAVTPAVIDDARTEMDLARIELDRARIALDDRTIEAPFDGFVGITNVDPGDRIGPDTAITTLDDRRVLLVSFELPEVLIDQLAVRQAISVAPWSGRGRPAKGRPAEGRIVDIGSRIDPVSRTFVARAHVDNADDRLRPGMSFRVTLTLEGERYPVVPEVSVQWGGEGAYVWTVHDHKARRVGIRIIQRRQGKVLVDADLAAGERVVMEGVQRMREGLEVSYREPGAAIAEDEAPQLYPEGNRS